MLALTDEALARLAIGATRLRSNGRTKWLREVARRLDPPPRPLTRQARWKARQRDGKVIVRLELDRDDIVLALLTSQRLTEAEALDHCQVERALGDIVAEWAHRWNHR
jgi:hypothetical protein